MYNLHLTPEQLEIRDTVRAFAAKEIKPIAEKSARMEAVDRSPQEGALTQAAELGLKTLLLAEEAGGSGGDALTAMIIAEEIAVGDPDTAAILTETALVARAAFGMLATSAQTKALLAKIESTPLAQLAWARGLAEREVGNNYHRTQSTAQAMVSAVKSGNTYVLNGTARGVANSPLAGLVIVSAASDAKSKSAKGLLAIAVPRGAQGMTVKSIASGKFHGACGDITFDNCKVPADHLLGGADGVAAAKALAWLDAVPASSAVALGVGRAAYEAAIDYSKLRVQGGRPIIEHQAIADKLASSAVRIETARSAIWAAAWAAEHPDAVSDGSLSRLPLATIARIHTAEAMHRAAKDCAECFGAMGVMRDMPQHKYIDDARRFLHADGGVAEHKFRLAEAISGFRRE